jgi:hypothetical protein
MASLSIRSRHYGSFQGVPMHEEEEKKLVDDARLSSWTSKRQESREVRSCRQDTDHWLIIRINPGLRILCRERHLSRCLAVALGDATFGRLT